MEENIQKWQRRACVCRRVLWRPRKMFVPRTRGPGWLVWRPDLREGLQTRVCLRAQRKAW